MERRNAWLSYTEAEEKELEQVAKRIAIFLIWEKQSVNV